MDSDTTRLHEAAPSMLAILEWIVQSYLDNHQATGAETVTLSTENVGQIWRVVKAAGGHIGVSK